VATTSTSEARYSGDSEDFERLFVEGWPKVFSYAWVLLRDREDAEDIAAETFIRAYAAWTDGRGPSTDAFAWLIVIARHLVIDRRRRHRLIDWLPLRAEAGSQVTDPGLDASETALWFRQLAGALSSRQHEAFLLRYEFDLADDQIGTVMGISAGAVRTLVSRALASLRDRPEVWQ
jgi:RNA polymerase sigma-70 factor (ECF subfamily)